MAQNEISCTIESERRKKQVKQQLDAKLQQKIQELKTCYEKGEMDGKEIHDLLDIEVMVELAKPAEEINNAWIDACVNLMAYTDQECLAVEPDAQETNRILPKRKHWQLPPLRLPGQWALPTFYKVGIAVFTFLLLVGGVLRWSWLYPAQSADGQEYYIRGKQVEVMEGGEARADDPNLQVEECVTQDFNELCEFLGFTPALPTWVPEGWTLTEYYGCFRGHAYDYESVYEKTGVEDILRYSFSYTTEPEHKAVTYFQDGVGYTQELANGKEVYLYTNAGARGAIWHTNCTIESVFGPISEEEITRMVESIPKKGEDK